MVWAGSTVYFNVNKLGQYTFNQSGFDADGEIGDILDLFDLAVGLGKVPQWASIWLTSTHATEVTDVVSVKLQGSVDGTNWDDLAEIVDADVGNGGTVAEESDVISATAFPTVGYRYFRVNCITVGAGNTLSVFGNIW